LNAELNVIVIPDAFTIDSSTPTLTINLNEHPILLLVISRMHVKLSISNLIFSSAQSAREERTYETIWHAREDILADYFLRKISMVSKNKRNSLFKNWSLSAMTFALNWYLRWFIDNSFALVQIIDNCTSANYHCNSIAIGQK
jgi:hypothetical protein